RSCGLVRHCSGGGCRSDDQADLGRRGRADCCAWRLAGTQQGGLMVVLPAVWLLVIGYGLVYIGYQNQRGIKTSFQDAFFGSGSGSGGETKTLKEKPLSALADSSGGGRPLVT